MVDIGRARRTMWRKRNGFNLGFPLFDENTLYKRSCDCHVYLPLTLTVRIERRANITPFDSLRLQTYRLLVRGQKPKFDKV